MASYSISQAIAPNGAVTSSGTISRILGVYTGPTDYATISNIQGHFDQSNYSQNYGFRLGVASSLGTYRKSNITALAQNNSGDTSSLPGLFAVTRWLVNPGLPANFLRAWVCAYASPRDFRFDFPRGLKLAPSNALLFTFTLTGESAKSVCPFQFNFEVDA